MVDRKNHPLLLWVVLLVLALPQIAGAQGRSVYDRGLIWQGDWMVKHYPERMFLRGRYGYISELAGVRLLGFNPVGDTGYSVETLDFLGESSADNKFIVCDSLLVFGVREGLVMVSRQGDHLTVIDTTLLNYGRLYHLTPDSLLLTGRGIASLRDPHNVHWVWQSPYPLFEGSMLINNRLIAISLVDYRVRIYDISDLENSVPTDTLSNRITWLWEWPPARIGNTVMINGTTDPDQNCLLFIHFDDEMNLESEHMWSWQANIGWNSNTYPWASGVLNDTLFAIFNPIDHSLFDQPVITTFDPDLLPGNPEVNRYFYDYSLFDTYTNRMGTNIQFQDSLLYLERSPQSYIMNLKNPANPVIMYQNNHLAPETNWYVRIVDKAGPELLVRRYDLREPGQLASNIGLQILRFGDGPTPDTLAFLPDFEPEYEYTDIQFSDTTLLAYKHYQPDFRIFHFNAVAGTFRQAYTLPYQLTTGDSWGPECDLFRQGDATYAVVSDDSRILAFLLGENSATLLDSTTIDEEILEVNWCDIGIIVSTYRGLFWYRLDPLDHLTLVDCDTTRTARYYIEQDGPWLGNTRRLYFTGDDSLQLVYTFGPEYETRTIRAIEGTLLVLQGNYGCELIDFTDGDYTNTIAYFAHTTGYYSIQGDTVWHYSINSFVSQYTLTGSMAVPSPMVGAKDSHPFSWQLSPAWPNPFNASTRITITVPARGNSTLSIYDLLGRRVAVLNHGVLLPGTHAFTFSPDHLSSGVYFVQLHTPNSHLARKIVYLK